ncbi:glycoside hydrolase 43 family protein [Flavilitoribacter nigricans DSM 23189 = NBRC 102662]|uniref:Glycoside hydrolase 43 family protein n=2 Tax=Flavilitoribacter TaxID=2762562 RepID=A0A2D0MZH0_FLAN2|nr:glycoside hydrolase 43 family protein [Flavilitoribacter nigricans DSM 23189 = NBRC 102662]
MKPTTTGEEPPITDAPRATSVQNPILAGFNPDPSICRVSDDYYLVNSSFAYFPGIPILHSKDLIHWEQIGAAIDRTEQVDLSEQGISRGFFAPAISYDDGWFYIICTLIDNGGNFIVRSRQPEGPYSEPYWLPELNGGIDPSLFFDKNGKAYVVYNHGAPDRKPLYSGHRTIRMRELNKETLQVVGEELLLVNGGVDISQEPVWIEAPHIYQKDGYYYLMCAEGGTGYNHSEVIFRSEKVSGPYVPHTENPILTQRHLDRNRPHPITTAGHADLVELPSGEWWAVFLACRPYRGDHFNTGRETFLAPVKWIDGWPVINPDFEEVQYEYPAPATAQTSTASVPLNGQFNYHIDFTQPLDPRWLFLRNVKEAWYQSDTDAGTLSLQLRPETIAERGNPSLMLRRQTHLNGQITTYMEFTPEQEQEMAGLLILQNQDHYYFINKTADKLQLLKQTEAGYETLAEQSYTPVGVHLRIEARGDQYNFSYSENGVDFTSLLDGVDATYLSTETAGGFVGCLYGLYATSNGEPSKAQAVFDYVEIKNE